MIIGMRERDHLDYERDPKLKPLYANLKRVNIGNYLVANEFDHLMTEWDLDDSWRECREEAEAEILNGVESFEDAFFILINILLAERDGDEFEEIVIEIILDFLEWNRERVEIKRIVDCFRDLDFDESLIGKFVLKARKISKSKRDQRVTSVDIGDRDPVKVFIIHGHDKGSRLELEKLLTEFGLKPIVLQDRPGDSLDTIITKFEKAAKECGSAIALFTPDDELKNGTFRPRQNVVLELGYFMGRDKLKDRRLIILNKNPIEGPSDIHGVETINFDKSIEEVAMKLQKQLKHLGVAK